MAKKFDPKAKAKRQKIIAAVLGVLLLGVLAYEVPSLMKSMNKKPPPPVAAPAPVVGTPIVGGPVTTDPLAAPVAATTLTDSDPLAQAGSGQLLSFDRFSSKDPVCSASGCHCLRHRPDRPRGARSAQALRRLINRSSRLSRRRHRPHRQLRPRRQPRPQPGSRSTARANWSTSARRSPRPTRSSAWSR